MLRGARDFSPALPPKSQVCGGAFAIEDLPCHRPDDEPCGAARESHADAVIARA